jgi:hypothetical protein
MNAINFLDFHFVGTNVENSLGLVQVILFVQEIARVAWGKGFDLERAGKSGGTSGTSTAHKGSESDERG